MARMRRKGGGAGPIRAERKKTSPETSPVNGPVQGAVARGMDRGSSLMVMGLMGALLGLFLLIGVLAPDTTDPHGKPSGPIVLWRLLFLLVPLAVMYGLLWGETVLGLLRRSKGRKRS